jgi:hypothetical protein
VQVIIGAVVLLLLVFFVHSFKRMRNHSRNAMGIRIVVVQLSVIVLEIKCIFRLPLVVIPRRRTLS